MAKISKHTWETFKQAAEVKHGSLFSYPPQEIVNIKVPVTIVCPIHGEFQQRPNDHLTGYGCKQCSVEQTAKNKRIKAALEFEQKSRAIHGDKYTYETVEYVNVRTKVEITCPQHGGFMQTPNNHLAARAGCPQCISKHMSIQCAAWLIQIEQDCGIQLQRIGNGGEFRIPNTRWAVDGYCETTNTVYEYHGDFWHGHPSLYDQSLVHPIIGKTFGELYAQTLSREQAIRDLGYNLVVTWEHEWNNLLKRLPYLK